MKKLRVCIIAHNAYGALRGRSGGHIGGAERQTSLMAQWFASHGHETTLITWDEGQPDGDRISGVTVRKTCASDAGLPGLRFFHPRLSGLYAAMRRADADVYYHNSAEYVTGLAARWCKRYQRKFVYSAAAELACDVRLPLLKKPYERWLYKQGVRLADVRVVQTRKQQELLREGWGLSSVVLPMPCPGPSRKDYQPFSFPNPPRVVWAGRVDPNKRLDWLLDIAERLPAIQFEVAAAINTSVEMAKQMVERARKLPNVRWHGSVPREAMPDFYRGATCLCCTSMHEGFPNIFVEAWSHGVPVVTTFDPDGMATQLGIGRAASAVDGLVTAISHFCSDEAAWRESSRRAREYYVSNHQVDAAMERFEAEFNGLLMNQSGNRKVAEGLSEVPAVAR